MDVVWPYVAALVPTIVVASFFYAIMKRILEGDRNERMAQRRFESEQDARQKGPATEEEASPPENPDRGV